MTARDRVLSFDELKGVVVVEAGVTLGELMHQVPPLGWALPLLPGHAGWDGAGSSQPTYRRAGSTTAAP
ncbi:hypothetical protein [Kribbella koreensis]